MKALLLAGMIGVLSLAALAETPPSVSIENFTFKPPTLTAHAGAHVTFKNADDIPHSVVLSDGSYHSRALDTGESVDVAFPKPGDYRYFCGLHPHMQGLITVVP